MDGWEKEAAEQVPIGYKRVFTGKILPDDLVYSLFTKEFLRHDDPSWLEPRSMYVYQACFVIREIGPTPPKAEVPPEDLERDNLIHSQQTLFLGF